MFRTPLRKDPLVVGWVVLLFLGGLSALSNNTTWSGSLQADLVAAFLRDLIAVLVLSVLLLMLAAWLRTRPWRVTGPLPRRAPLRHDSPLPWTGGWLGNPRQTPVQQFTAEGPARVVCRHGAELDGPVPAGQEPVLRALSVSPSIVRPGGTVSVTWCFRYADSVAVDGSGRHAACGETQVRIGSTRRVDLMGRNRHGTTSVATAAVLAIDVPAVQLPTVTAPPPVDLRTDVVVNPGVPAPITRRLDDFWATAPRSRSRPPVPAPPPLVGVPASVIDRLRSARTRTGES